MIKRERERERDGVVSVRGLWRESEEAQVTKSLQDLLRDQGLQNPSLIIYFKEFRYFCFWAFVGYLIMIELNSQKKKKKKIKFFYWGLLMLQLSCIDCGQTFGQQSVQGHTQCITEAVSLSLISMFFFFFFISHQIQPCAWFS